MAADTVAEYRELMKGQVKREKTIDRYARWVERFEAWRPADDPTEAMLREFDSFMADEEYPDYPWENARGKAAPPEYAYQTRLAAISANKHWLRHGYGEEVVTEVQNICVGEPEPFDPTILDKSEIQRVHNYAGLDCDNPDCETAIALGYDAIMRGSELADARVEDVDDGDQTIYVRAKKGSEPTHIQLRDSVWRKLKAHINANPGREYLFQNAYDNPWTAAAWNQHFRRKHHPAGFHAFARHSAITNRLRDGEDFGSVYLRARHQQPSTTLKYAHHVGIEEAPDWLNV